MMELEQSWRYTTLGILFSALAAFVVLQMVRIQTSPQAEVFRSQGEVYAGNWRTVKPARGQIYDRLGNLLAGNITVYEVGVELAFVENPSTIALVLNAVTDADYEDVFAAASRKPSSNAVFAVLANNVTEEQKLRLEQFTEEMNLAYGESKDESRPS